MFYSRFLEEILNEEFCIYVLQGNWSRVFFAVSLSGLGIRVVLVSHNECGGVLSPSILRNSLRSVGVSSYRVWLELAGNSSGSVFCWQTFISVLTSLIVMNKFNLFISL